MSTCTYTALLTGSSIIMVALACTTSDPVDTSSPASTPPRCRLAIKSDCANDGPKGCAAVSCLRGYECCVGACNDGRCQKIYKSCSPNITVNTSPQTRNTCDMLECRRDQNCCHEQDGTPKCIDMEDPVGAGIYPLCPLPTTSVPVEPGVQCQNVTPAKTCREANCSLIQSCCVDHCGGVKCMDKFGYCPSDIGAATFACPLFIRENRCDVKSCQSGFKCCVGVCQIPQCIAESVPTSPCSPSICAQKCGSSVFCENIAPCSNPRCLCHDPKIGTTAGACRKTGTGCDGYTCPAGQVCCANQGNYPQCANYTRAIIH